MSDGSYSRLLDGSVSFDDYLSEVDVVARLKTRTFKLFEDTLKRAFFEVERRDADVEIVLLSTVTYGEVRKFDNSVFVREREAEILKQGVVGTIWKAIVRPSMKVPTGVILLVSKELKGCRRLACTLTIGCKPSDGARTLLDLKGQVVDARGNLDEIERSIDEALVGTHGVIEEDPAARSLSKAIRDMDKAVSCLRFEVSEESIMKDVEAKWAALKAAVSSRC